MQTGYVEMIDYIAWFFILFTGSNLLIALIICALSAVALAKEKKWMHGFEDRLADRWHIYPSISIVIPAFNEEDSIEASVKAALKCRYPKVEIVVVNDGSSDATLETMLAKFPLEPMSIAKGAGLICEPVRNVWRSSDGLLTLVDKHNGGKADAINAGINVACSPLICVVDADTLVARDTLLHLAEPFLDNPNMVVTGGFIRLKPAIRGGMAKALYWLQELEFARSYGCFRAGLNLLHANIIISGALGLFKRSAVIEVGGYNPLAVGEDMELVLRLHDHCLSKGRSYAIAQIGHAFCQTAACDTLDLLRRQRLRWQRGLLSSLNAYRNLLFNHKAGGVGMIAVPYLVLFDVFGPFVELAGLIYLLAGVIFGWLQPDWLWAIAAIILLAAANNLLCLLIDGVYLKQQLGPKARLRMFLIGLTEPLGYHWLNLWWRIRGTILYITSVQTRTAWSMRQKKS